MGTKTIHKQATPTADATQPIDDVTIAAIDRQLASIGELHSAPQVVQDILAMTRSIDFDIKKLTEKLSSDPALSAKILRLVNSASFGLRQPVTGLHKAVVMLGQRTLRLVVMTFSLVDKLAKGAGGKVYGEFWKNSLTMAICSSRLARCRPDLDPDEAYSAGLLADLGLLVLAQANPKDYPELFFAHPHDATLLAAERERFGCDHAQISGRLMERWGFSPHCVLASRFHHESRPGAGILETTIRASALVSDVLWSPNSDKLTTARTILSGEFGFDTDKLIGLALNCKEEILAQADLYGVTLDREIDVQSILEEARRLFVGASIETAMDFDAAMSVMEDRPIDLDS